MALTERYVTSTGTDTYANSTNSATPMSLSTALANATAGDRINIKAGTYTRAASDTFATSGTTTSPIIWRGYNSTVGDLDTVRTGKQIDTANFPNIAYNSTFVLTISGNYNVVQNLNITGTRSGAVFVMSGADGVAANCRVYNASTNTAAIACTLTGSRLHATGCDFVLASGSTTGALMGQAANGFAHGCYITNPVGLGAAIRGSFMMVRCLVESCATGIYMDTTTGTPVILDCTVYGCSGNAYESVASTTGTACLFGNHITDNGGYAFDWNGSTCAKHVAFNRTRDNTSGVHDAADDWTNGTTIMHVTTDNGAASSDYVNAGTDFSLIAAAAGRSKGPLYKQDLGAFPSASGAGLTGYGSA